MGFDFTIGVSKVIQGQDRTRHAGPAHPTPPARAACRPGTDHRAPSRPARALPPPCAAFSRPSCCVHGNRHTRPHAFAHNPTPTRPPSPLNTAAGRAQGFSHDALPARPSPAHIRRHMPPPRRVSRRDTPCAPPTAPYAAHSPPTPPSGLRQGSTAAPLPPASLPGPPAPRRCPPWPRSDPRVAPWVDFRRVYIGCGRGLGGGGGPARARRRLGGCALREATLPSVRYEVV